MKLIHMFLIISLMLPTLATANNQQNGNRKAIALGFATLATVCYTLAARNGVVAVANREYLLSPDYRKNNKIMTQAISDIAAGAIFLGCGILSTIAAVKLYKKAKAEEQR